MGLQEELMGATGKKEKEVILKKYRDLAAQEVRLKQLETAPTQPQQTPFQQTAPKPVFAPNVPTVATLSLEELQIELMKRKEDLNKKVNDMILDANAYRVNIPSIRLLTEDKSYDERMSYVGNISVITGVPIIVVLAYIGEIYGFTDEINKKMESLMNFYTVKEVLNVKR
jgi:hypothetical protein